LGAIVTRFCSIAAHPAILSFCALCSAARDTPIGTQPRPIRARLRTTIEQQLWRLTQPLERSAVPMGKATVKMVAGGDGSLQLAPGYRYLWAHGIVTVLLLIALLAAAWEFMGWVVAPSACLVDSSPSSACSSPAPASWGTTSPVVSRLVQADESRR
jgi:hypothetical protein